MSLHGRPKGEYPSAQHQGTPESLLGVCADDFGLTPSVSTAIVDLAARDCLSAVSCLVTSADWPSTAPLLCSLPRPVQRGLHFNLTEGAPISSALRRDWPRFPPLPRLITAAWLRRLPLAAIAAEWQAQWNRFVEATGDVPAFVDGHQHVHHLPGVRGVMLAALAAVPAPVAVRSTAAPRGPASFFKRAVIRRSGGAALEAELRRRGVPHNTVLLGCYDFIDPDYRGLMRAWLAQVPAEGALLFCHPGAEGADNAVDPIARARQREAAYLGSDAFGADLQEAGVRLGPAWVRRSSGD